MCAGEALGLLLFRRCASTRHAALSYSMHSQPSMSLFNASLLMALSTRPPPPPHVFRSFGIRFIDCRQSHIQTAVPFRRRFAACPCSSATSKTMLKSLTGQICRCTRLLCTPNDSKSVDGCKSRITVINGMDTFLQIDTIQFVVAE